MINSIFFLFVLIVCVLLLYYLFIFSKFAFLSSSKKKYNNIPVSILICAKNEAENLQKNLPFILKQNFTNFELVLVNDNSTDATLAVMNSFKEKYQNIVIIDVNDGISNKKKALSKGIDSAKHNHLLLTDADCKPNSNNWISEMTSHFNTEKSVVLGYGAYEKIKGSWLNKLIRFETLLTAIQYFSYTKIGLPYMGVGRNMGYTKNNFSKVNGFTKHKDLKSGDDDLFINQIATKNNTAVCITKSSFTLSKPHTNFKKWILQKRRHITTATHYKPIHQLLLGIFYICQFLFWLFAITLLIQNFNIKFVLVLILIKIGLQYLIFGLSAKKLDEKDLILYIPFLELFLIVIQMSIFIQNLISKPKHW